MKSNDELKVEIGFIKIKDRIRKESGDLSLLKDSIQRMGLVHPIVVDSEYRLLSGYRRLEAIKQLGWKMAPIKILSVDINSTGKEWEIEENLCRKDFSNQELEEAKEILNSMRKKSIFSKLWKVVYKIFNFPKGLVQKFF